MQNVLFVMLDATRRDRVAPFADVDFTPHIQELADQGRVYEDAVAQSSWTLPVHASLFTGLYPWEHGATQEQMGLQDDVGRPRLPEIFSEAGYMTACCTENIFISPKMGLTDGFMEQNNFMPVTDTLPSALQTLWERIGSDWQRRVLSTLFRAGSVVGTFSSQTGTHTPEAVEWAQRVMDENDDWFVFLNLMDAHHPVYAPNEYLEKHAPGTDISTVHHSEIDAVRGDVEVPWDDYRRVYDAAIDYMDDQIGRLIEFLEKRGELEETIIVIAADHGEHLGERGFSGHMLSVSEELVSIPLVIADPDGNAGVVEQPVELRSLYDYLPRAAGVKSDSRPDMAVDMARGGLAWPEMHIQMTGRNPGGVDEEDVYARRRFIHTTDLHCEKKEAESGTEYQAVQRSTGETVSLPPDIREELDRIGAAEERGGSQENVDSAEVKQRLEDLGYR